MKKIISLFWRNYDGDHLVRDEVVEGAEWVIAGEGVATEKLDGTCCMIDEAGKFWKRYDRKNGKVAPAGFIAAQEADEVTGHQPGWLPVGDGPDDRWFREGFSNLSFADSAVRQGKTYELLGPKINGNPYGMARHDLFLHGDRVLGDVPRTFNELKAYFAEHLIEGVVWHRNHVSQTRHDLIIHSDMVKIKRRDFGLPWPVKRATVCK